MRPPKWTPGPWRLGDDATGKPLTIWAAEPGVCITSVFDNRMGDDTPPMTNAKGNARLIAAAPELYDALREAALQIEYLHDKFDHTGSGEGVLARINAALTKARG